jgi:hypothetical protein
MEGGSRTPYEHEQGGQGGPGREAAEPGAELFRPRYLFTPRPAGWLAVGELAVEPVLGPVRVAGVRQPEEEYPEHSRQALPGPAVAGWRSTQPNFPSLPEPEVPAGGMSWSLATTAGEG